MFATASVLPPPTRGAAHSIDPLELYASGIDTSDYVSRVAPLVRDAAPRIGDLLDLGAGGGQLGAALREPGRAWTAVEPSRTMTARLMRLRHPPTIVASGWEDVDIPDREHDTVLAANVAAPLTQTAQFLDRCRRWARQAVVWIVPAQAGPRGLCLAACLPAEWHGEDETPGLERVLGRLPVGQQPDSSRLTNWTFSLVSPELSSVARHLADRLGWDDGDPRRALVGPHLRSQARRHPRGFQLDVPKRSAVLAWRLS